MDKVFPGAKDCSAMMYATPQASPVIGVLAMKDRYNL